jgi:hypothetical protein
VVDPESARQQVAQTVEHDLPEEVAFLEAYDRFNAGTQEIVDMPSRPVELLRKFLDQNSGRLSARARRNEFAMLSNEEGDAIERLYTETFSHRVEQPRQPQAPDTSSR